MKKICLSLIALISTNYSIAQCSISFEEVKITNPTGPGCVGSLFSRAIMKISGPGVSPDALRAELVNVTTGEKRAMEKPAAGWAYDDVNLIAYQYFVVPYISSGKYIARYTGGNVCEASFPVEIIDPAPVLTGSVIRKVLPSNQCASDGVLEIAYSMIERSCYQFHTAYFRIGSAVIHRGFDGSVFRLTDIPNAEKVEWEIVVPGYPEVLRGSERFIAPCEEMFLDAIAQLNDNCGEDIKGTFKESSCGKPKLEITNTETGEKLNNIVITPTSNYTSFSVSDPPSGKYSIVAKFGIECEETTVVTIKKNNNTPGSISVTDANDVSNFGCNDGKFTLNYHTQDCGNIRYFAAIDNKKGYSATLTEISNQPVTFENLPAGRYDIKVWDQNNNEFTSDRTISEPSSKGSLSISNVVNVQGENCSDGQVKVNYNTDDCVYPKKAEIVNPDGVSISKDLAGGSVVLTGLSAGKYTVKIVGIDGNEEKEDVTLIEPEPSLNISVFSTNPDKYNCLTGTFTVNLNTKDCYSAIVVALIRGNAEFVSEVSLTYPVNEYTFTGLAEGEYFARVQYNKYYESGKSTIVNPPFSCSDHGITINSWIEDEPSLLSLCRYKIKVDARVKNLDCSDGVWALALVGCNTDGTNCAAINEVNLTNDAILEFEVWELPQGATWSISGVYNSDNTINLCKLNPTKLATRTRKPCDGIIRTEINHPTFCTNGTVKVSLQTETCGNGWTFYLFNESRSIQLAAQEGKKEFTFTDLPPGVYTLKVGYGGEQGAGSGFMGYCTEETKVTLTAKSFEESLIVYPNPVSGQLFYELSSCGSTTEVTLHDNTGHAIRRVMANKTPNTIYKGSLDMTSLVSGVYTINVYDGINHWTRRVIKL